MKQNRNCNSKFFLWIQMVSLTIFLGIGCSTAPAQRDPASGNCFNTGKSFGYDNETLMPLCSGVMTDESVYCYRDSTMIHHLTEAQAIEACRPRLNNTLVR